MKLIQKTELRPNWQNIQIPCYCCGTKQNVKYRVELYNFGKDIPKDVCACDKCVARFSKMEVAVDK